MNINKQIYINIYRQTDIYIYIYISIQIDRIGRPGRRGDGKEGGREEVKRT